jgi:hypothetical protein
VESPPLPLAAVLPAAGPVLAAAGPGLAAVPALLAAEIRGGVASHALVRRALAVFRSQHDLELVQLIPFGIGSLPLGNGEQRLQARAGGRWLLFIHMSIISRVNSKGPDIG